MNKLHLNTSQLGYFISASSLSVAIFASFGISPAMSLVGNRSDRLASLGIALRLESMVCFGGLCLGAASFDECRRNSRITTKSWYLQ